MIRAVIFDLDGTLLDSLDDLANSVNLALRTNGLPERLKSEIRSFLGNGIRRLVEQAAGEEVTGERFEALFETFRKHYIEHSMDLTRPFPGIISLLADLKAKGVKMAIVSNKLHPAVLDLNEYFFKEYITTAVGESATVRRKPNPDAVLHALQDLNCRADEAIYVGDSEVDLETAQNAGLPCALVLWGFRDEAFLRSLPGAEIFLNNPSELIQLINTH